MVDCFFHLWNVTINFSAFRQSAHIWLLLTITYSWFFFILHTRINSLKSFVKKIMKLLFKLSSISAILKMRKKKDLYVRKYKTKFPTTFHISVLFKCVFSAKRAFSGWVFRVDKCRLKVNYWLIFQVIKLSKWIFKSKKILEPTNLPN